MKAFKSSQKKIFVVPTHISRRLRNDLFEDLLEESRLGGLINLPIDDN